MQSQERSLISRSPASAFEHDDHESSLSHGGGVEVDLEQAEDSTNAASQISASRASRLDDQEASVSRGALAHESTVVGSRAAEHAASSSSHPLAAAPAAAPSSAASSSSSASSSHHDPSMFSAEAFPSHSSESSLPFGAVAARLPAGSAPETHPPRGPADKLMELNMRAALLARTPPPPFPEYQKWGKNKAVGVKGKTFWVGLKVFGALEFMGEVMADFLGFYDSRYQYVVDAYEREKAELAREKAERKEARRQARGIAQTEEEARQQNSSRESRARQAAAAAAAAGASATSSAQPASQSAASASASASIASPSQPAQSDEMHLQYTQQQQQSQSQQDAPPKPRTAEEEEALQL